MINNPSFVKYQDIYKSEWNQFNKNSRNGTFLIQREFMEYHDIRFLDHSLLVFHMDRIIGVMPAHIEDNCFISHNGLTYGGFIFDNRMTAPLMMTIVKSLLDYLKGIGVNKLVYKSIPHIYHQQPSEEDVFALHQVGAVLKRCDLSSAIPIQRRLKFSKSKLDGLRKSRRAGIEVRETLDWDDYWSMLTQVLADRHSIEPTHNISEMSYLAKIFPHNIKLYCAFEDNEIIAGLVVFVCGLTIHIQYMASSDRGREVGGLDLIIDHILTCVFQDCRWLDFGISTTDQGTVLNSGLVRQKEMFGARSVIYAQYNLDI